MQLILHPGTHLHQAVTMPQELAQIAILGVRYGRSRIGCKISRRT
jgi:hypothetical protein